MTNVWVPPMGVMMGSADIDFGSNPAPIFYAPFGDLGNGIANTTPAISYGITKFFTRGTAGWTRLRSGLWTSVAAGNPRSYYGATPGTLFTGRYDGVLLERSSQNNCLWSRDWTNAAWTKTNMTATKDATGIDGVANSATRLTANANNATVSQNSGVNNQHVSVFVRRISGTGTVEVQLAAGVYVNITSQLAVFGAEWSSTPFTQASFGLAGVAGIRLGTSGDQVAVDMAQIESQTTGSYTTPIPTTVAADIRLADSLSYSNFSFNPSQLSFGVTVSPIFPYNAALGDTDYIMGAIIDANNYSMLVTSFFNNFIQFQLNRASSFQQASCNNGQDVFGMNPANIVGTFGPINGKAISSYWNENNQRLVSPTSNLSSPVKVGSILDFNRSPVTALAFDSFAIKNARVYNIGLDAEQVSILQKNQY